MKLPKIFSSKIFLGAAIIAVGIMIIFEYQQWQQRSQVDQEISALQEQEKQLVDNNKQLQQSINFLSTPEYQEKLARLQLNLKKEGEIVIEFPTESTLPNQITNNHTSDRNPYLWWEYIFLN